MIINSSLYMLINDYTDLQYKSMSADKGKCVTIKKHRLFSIIDVYLWKKTRKIKDRQYK